MFNFKYQIPKTDQYLDVDFEYEPETGDGFNEPLEPAGIYINTVRYLTVDMTDMLNDRVFRDLEESAYVYILSLQENDDDIC
jgi:hypothetical protein